MTNAELSVRYENKRIGVRNLEGEWFFGKLAYIATTMFPAHGTIAYFGRRPVYNIDINTIFEYEDRLDIIEGKGRYLE